MASAPRRLGLLTGGGDCPGLNAVIRAVVRKGRQDGHTLFGFSHGWAGVLSGEGHELTDEETKGILPRGGTILGSSRTNPYKLDDGPERVKATLADNGIEALVAGHVESGPKQLMIEPLNLRFSGDELQLR